MEPFSITESLRYGWEVVRGRFAFFMLLMATSIAVSALPAAIQRFLENGEPVFAFLALIPAWVLGMLVQLGLVLIPLRIYDGEDVAYVDLFACYDVVPRYIMASIAYMLIVMFGLVLLVVPGIYWGIRYQFFGYHIVDEGAGALESLQRSGQITKGAMARLGWLFLALLGLNVVGVLCLFFGLLVSYAVTLVACAYVYRKLCARAAGGSLSPAV